MTISYNTNGLTKKFCILAIFDRRYAEWKEACDDAWGRIFGFIEGKKGGVKKIIGWSFRIDLLG